MKQNSIFFSWILLLPFCARVIDEWSDDRKNGFFEFLMSIGVHRFEYIIAKFIFAYAVFSIISGFFWMGNMSAKLRISTAIDVPNINYLSVIDYLMMVARLRQSEMLKGDILSYLQDTDLSKVANRSLNLLSCTQKERLRVVSAFIGDADIVLIDTPTREQLPETRSALHLFIEARKTKSAIVIATYDAEEAEILSDRIVMLSEGYVVFNGPTETFLDTVHSSFEICVWPVDYFRNDQIKDIMKLVTCEDKKLRSSVKLLEMPNGKLRITIPVIYRKSLPLIWKELEQQAGNLDISYFELSRPNLHDIYTTACFEPQQYAPLANYDDFKKMVPQGIITL
ncbi:unnamed protein product [Caenorhabditis bovis]|uniref:ABC transporter domain-containing protein n=1 Tax=Caenorhabditis bovis TaxID=2654633 RepID=A0A8S1FA15_9PELO|nr:unnamed protein product [Caenorhabditis bovis]